MWGMMKRRPRRHGDAPREPKPRQLEDGDGARRAGDGGTYLLISLPRDTEDFLGGGSWDEF